MFSASVVVSVVLGLVNPDAGPPRKHPRAHFGRVEAGAGGLLGQADGFAGGGAVAYEFRAVPWFGAGPKYSLFVGSRGFVGHLIGPEFRAYPFPFFRRGDWQINAAPGLALGAFGPTPYVRAGTGFEFRVRDFIRLGPALEFANLFTSGGGTMAFGIGLSGLFGGPVSR